MIASSSILGRFGSLFMLTCLAMIFLGTSTAYAGCSDGSDGGVDEILGSGNTFLEPLPPISDLYTREVLKLSRAAVVKADTYTKRFGQRDMDYWITRVGEFVGGLIDTKLRLIKQERDLLETTPCLNIDLTLMETMMEKVRCNMHSALDDKRYISIMLHEKTMTALTNWHLNLLTGSRDNKYEDKSASYMERTSRYPLVDPPLPKWCCDTSKIRACVPKWDQDSCNGTVYEKLGGAGGCLEASSCAKVEMCPFHSDYLPPTVIGTGSTTPSMSSGPFGGSGDDDDDEHKAYGYGCDLETLEPYYGLSFAGSKIDEYLDAEYEALEQFLIERDDFIDEAGQEGGLKELSMNLNLWTGRADYPIRLEWFGQTTEENREHRERIGCLAEDGPAGLSSRINEDDDSDGVPNWADDDDGDGLRNDLDPDVDGDGILNTEDRDYDTWKYHAQEWPQGAAKWEVRGPFSFEKDEYRLARAYENMRDRWGQQRPYPPGFSESKQPKYVNDEGRRLLKQWDRKQEQLEGAMVPKATDAIVQVIEKFEPIRAAVGELAQYASWQSRGTRGFARNFAYFLRRSCLNRPCSERLNRILKIVFEADCFPYTNGTYMSASDLHTRCESSAGL